MFASTNGVHMAKKTTKKKGLWHNIRAKQKRIAAGSGEKMRKKGAKGAPTEAAMKASKSKKKGKK